MEFQLCRLRKQAKVTQKELSKALGVTERVFGSWERQETPITLEDACLVAEYLGVSLDELAGRNSSKLIETDQRKKRINTCYESMNDAGRETLARVAQGLERDASNRVEKIGDSVESA